MAATKAQLYAEAEALDIEGRSKMTKKELQAAIDAVEVESDETNSFEEFDDFEESAGDLADDYVEVEEVEVPVEINPPAPAISQEPTIQGGLTFLTDRAQ